MINWWRNDYDISEISAITNAIKNKKISQGELTEQFERALAEFLNIPFFFFSFSSYFLNFFLYTF